MKQFDIELIDTRFSYSVKCRSRLYAHDFDSEMCLVTCNAISPIDERKVIGKWWFQHIVHDVRHVAWLVPLFRFIQGKSRVGRSGFRSG